jgi:hypothetical protein
MSYVSNIYAVRDSKGKVIDYNKKKSPAKKPAFPQKKSAAKPVTQYKRPSTTPAFQYKKLTTKQIDNMSNLNKKFEILNKKMKMVQMEYKTLQKELRAHKRTKK